MDERFKEAVAKLLLIEGGYVNDPSDPGGETKYGVSKRSYPDLDIAQLTREDAEEIYFRDFWLKLGCDKIQNPKIAEKLFSLAVNIGISGAVTMLQIAVRTTGGRKINIDGHVGEQTINAINTHENVGHLLSEYKLYVIGYYCNREKSNVFLKGWIRRALA